jgi:hypothetical protein
MSGWLITAFCQIGLFTSATVATTNSSDPSDPTEYHRQLEQALQSARTAAQSSSATARDLIKLAESYLDAGDDLYSVRNSDMMPMKRVRKPHCARWR